MKTVWFIRHAESAANAGLPTTYPDCIPLTTKGVEQAKLLSDNINIEPDLIILSSYIRTHQTAVSLIEKFYKSKTEIWPIHEFNFLSPDECLNTTVDQRKPWVNDYWKKCEAQYVHGIGAESFAEFKIRVLASIKRLEKFEYKFVVVFTHGHVIRAIWQYFITANENEDSKSMQFFRDKMSSLPIGNTAIFKAVYNNVSWEIIEPQFNPKFLS